MLSTGPSLPVDVMAATLHIQEAGGNEKELTTVSQGAYSIWPLVTYRVDNAHGADRIFYPSENKLIGQLTYQGVGLLLTAALFGVVIGLVLLRGAYRRLSGQYAPLLALFMCGFLLFMTGIPATHFILAVPLLILCMPFVGRAAYVLLVAAWSLTALVSMAGSMGLALSKSPELLAFPLSSNNGVIHLLMSLYTADGFLNAAALGNLIAFGVIAFAVFRSYRRTPFATPLAAKPNSPLVLQEAGSR
jgi:hypothetical protein